MHMQYEGKIIHVLVRVAAKMNAYEIHNDNVVNYLN